MLIAVVGGKLQGVEAVYLAQKAGLKTLVIDKNSDAPATGLCDLFLEYRFSPEHPVPKGCPKVDLILPAIEDTMVLMCLELWSQMEDIPLAFDPDAYRISSSKIKSHALFREMNLPSPLPWPQCSFPVVVKPDGESGSRGVEVFNDLKSLSARFPNPQGMDSRVIQEYMEGPSFSIEVVGSPGHYQALQVTDLYMDEVYDCKRITAPTKLAPREISRFCKLALDIASKIRLTGIMDVEVILHKDELKLLEIDARLPSQTPMAVFWSSGINIVERLVYLFLGKKTFFPEPEQVRYVMVEHIRVCGADIKVCGEHIMPQEGPLTVEPGFFGANEAVTSYRPGKKQWVATLILATDRKCPSRAARSSRPAAGSTTCLRSRCATTSPPSSAPASTTSTSISTTSWRA